MACYNVDETSIETAGKKAAMFSSVSHCYHRPRHSQWPYPLFAMIHATSRKQCLQTADSIAEAIGCSDFQVLFSERELKKERVQYFREPPATT
jgi:hypothetical protein